MIARNFIRFPEALRFQREMFSNGYHNNPRIMRLMQCIFDWRPSVPDWWKEAKGRARDLARHVKKSINDFFKGVIVAVAEFLEQPKECQCSECLRVVAPLGTIRAQVSA